MRYFFDGQGRTKVTRLARRRTYGTYSYREYVDEVSPRRTQAIGKIAI